MMKNLLYILFAVLLTSSSCRQEKKTGVDSSDAMVSMDTVPEIQLYTFDGGTVQVNNLELFSQDTTYQGQTKEFADAFFVIRHPKGILMWDAGLPEGLVALGEPFTSEDGAFTVSRKDSVHNQLSKIGITSNEVDFLALSHTHFDHSGHAERIKNAIWLVQESEFEWISSEEMERAQPDMFNAVNDLSSVQKLQGDHDVFGDGTVVIKSMPGHTPGHQVLFLQLKEYGPVLLTGDLYHLYESREKKTVPMFNTDVEQTLMSMEAFETFARAKGAKVILQHQKEDFDKMPRAPKFLK